MAGSSMTFTHDKAGNLRRLICDFVTDDSTGAASASTTDKIVGRVLKIVTDPGPAAPSANWDVVVTDENGLNPFAGCQNAAALLTRHESNTEQTYLQLLNADLTPIGIAAFPVVCGTLTVAVANGGNSKAGRIVIYYEAMG